MECNPPSTSSHKYIIVNVDYFTKSVDSMLTFENSKANVACFFFNHVIIQFNVMKQLVFDHNFHFKDEIWHDIASLLGFVH
jgi:hypothetical protein